MKRYLVYYILTTFLFVSCNRKADDIVGVNSATTFREKLFDSDLIDSLDERVLHHGDSVAYVDLKSIHYIAEQRFIGFLYYALIMSNKYNYKKASYDVYDILTASDSIIDDRTKEMANFYLEKSKIE